MKPYKNTALKRLPREVIGTILDMRRSGKTLRAIDDHLVERFKIAISVASIRTLCSGIPTPDHWGNSREFVRKAVAEGHTRTSAAEMYGVDRTTANKWCRDLPGSRSKK